MTTPAREPIRFLVFSASMRTGSLNSRLAELAYANIADFMDLVEAATHCPCVKRAWVEYLREGPDPEYDRVDVAVAG